MKLIQLNIWNGKLGKQIAKLINEIDPDFVCMQEVIDYQHDGMAIFDPIDKIMAKTNLKYKFMSPTYSLKFMQSYAEFGNAILSKHPFLTTKTEFVRGSHKQDFDNRTDDYNIRNFQVSSVKVKDKTLYLLNHHGMHIPSFKLGTPETENHMKKISTAIAKIDGPIILAGDFNLSPASKAIKLIDGKLINLTEKFNLTTTYTSLSNHPTEICDYIFVNDKVKVNNFMASNEVVSDHKALILDFDI